MGIGSKMAPLTFLLLLLLQFGWMLLPTASAAAAATAGQASCEEVRYQCAFDSACAEAMKHYFLMCDKLLEAGSTTCPETCLYALVALTTTRHGQRLLDCSCRDSFCEMMKTRVEVCRPLVIHATKNETIVPCEMARWVCQVNPQCSVALGYHMSYCKRVHQNMTCTERCLNSYHILRRQDKAFMLNRCRCTGRTALDCLHHKERLVRHCFDGVVEGVDDNETVDGDDGDGDVGVGDVGVGDGNGVEVNRKRERPKEYETDPDRIDVDLMLDNPHYQPDLERRQKLFDDGSSGSAVRPSRFAFVPQCILAVAAVLLVKRG